MDEMIGKRLSLCSKSSLSIVSMPRTTICSPPIEFMTKYSACRCGAAILIGYLVEALADLFSEVLRREKLVEEGQESIVHNGVMGFI